MLPIIDFQEGATAYFSMHMSFGPTMCITLRITLNCLCKLYITGLSGRERLRQKYVISLFQCCSLCSSLSKFRPPFLIRRLTWVNLPWGSFSCQNLNFSPRQTIISVPVILHKKLQRPWGCAHSEQHNHLQACWNVTCRDIYCYTG